MIDGDEEIEEGMKVVLKREKHLRCQIVDRKRKRMFEHKNPFSLEAVIGHPFGTEWEVNNKEVILVKREKEDQFAPEMENSALDNRNIVLDDETSQSLTEPDIRKMKKEGVTGNELIGKLIDSSTTFKNKTVYSKEKYLKKKKSRHLIRFTILKPTTRLICEAFFSRAPQRAIALRIDTLSQMLAATNIHSGCKVLIVENCQGVLVAAVMERLAGIGTIVQFHSEQDPIHNAVDAFNFTKDEMKILHTSHLRFLGSKFLNSSKSERIDQISSQGTEEKETFKKICEETLPSKNEEEAHGSVMDADRLEQATEREGANQDDTVKDDNGDVEEKTSEANSKQGTKRKQDENVEKREKYLKRLGEDQKVKEILQSRNMDALLIACRFDPLELTNVLIDFLAPSRPFAVFSPFKEPLLETFVMLKRRGNTVNAKLTETWLRDYQVLDQRTHPHVTMNGAGGYILTGIRVGGYK